jgi:hypothetical protein
LVEACDRHRLPGISNLPRLMDALAPYGPEEIGRACERIVTELDNGAPIRQPFGLLAAKAAVDDIGYFGFSGASVGLPGHLPPRPQSLVSDCVEVAEEPTEPDEALQAVRELAADPGRASELERLDAEVECRLVGTPGHGPLAGRMLRMAPLREALRADAWRDLRRSTEST